MITILDNLSSPLSLFITSDEQIFVGNGNSSNRVDRRILNSTRLSSPMSLCSTQCSGLFAGAFFGKFIPMVDVNIYSVKNVSNAGYRMAIGVHFGAILLRVVDVHH